MLGGSRFPPNARNVSPPLRPPQVMEPLCGVLYDVLRPLVVQLQDVDELCELVDILKHEVGAGFSKGSPGKLRWIWTGRRSSRGGGKLGIYKVTGGKEVAQHNGILCRWSTAYLFT